MKPWYKSKSLSLNTLALILAGALMLPEVQAIITPAWMPRIMAFVAVLNFWLRFKTNTAIE